MPPKVRGSGGSHGCGRGGRGGGRGSRCVGGHGGRNLVIKDGSSRSTHSLARGHANSDGRNEMTKNMPKSLTAFTNGWDKITNINQLYFIQIMDQFTEQDHCEILTEIYLQMVESTVKAM